MHVFQFISRALGQLESKIQEMRKIVVILHGTFYVLNAPPMVLKETTSKLLV